MTKFLNISTDNTLGGNSPSDVAVSSQKAVKEYVDSQTGTAPAFANITGQPTDNANLASALNAKYDASNPNGYTSNVGTVTSVNNVSPVNGNVTLSIPTVSDTYSATSSDAMSGKAVASAVSGYVPTSRTVNGKALSSNISLSASDVGALPDSTVIPTVNNATLTIQKNGTTVKTFTANASTDVTANITVPTKVSDLTNDSGFISGITSSDVTTALGYTPYNSSNPSGYQANVIETVKVNGTALTPSSKAVDVTVPTESTVSGWGFTKNAGTVTSVNNTSPDSGGNVTLSIPTVDQTYSASSTNAQSGVAINGAKFLRNTATGSNALTVGGTASSASGGVNVGIDSTATKNGANAFGRTAKATGTYSTALGINTASSGTYSTCVGAEAKASSSYAIQIGYGTNSTASTLSIGFNASSSANRKNWQLLDGTTGKIPSDRIPIDNSTITVNSSGQLTASGSGGGGASRNVGEIITSTIPLSDAGLHLLDGSVISGSGSYSAFVTYIAGLVSGHSELFTTEANWQTSVTNYGVCGKFVYDSVNNTVRLPKITGFTEGTIDPTVLGDLTQAGLPNITGTCTPWGYQGALTPTGAFSQKDTNKYAYNTSNNSQGATLTFDASQANPIYGNSTTVQPQSIKVLYYIVIATSTKTSIEVDIDEIATDLNGKADVDLSNCTKPHIVETYHSGTSWYRIWSDGWIEQGAKKEANIAVVNFIKNFSNTDYFFQEMAERTASTGDSYSYYRNKSANSITLLQLTEVGYWYACGY